MSNFSNKLALLSSSAILLIILALRFSILNQGDLVDPTESRYASVAQIMALDNDFITPKLPEPQGIVPYLGKPPLHFWLTAISYKTFGMSYFSSRFPSFISGILMLILVICFGRKFLGNGIGESAALLTISTALIFVLSGASVIDLTLSTCITASLVFFAYYYENPSRKWAIILGISLALGFLTKGPVAIAIFFFTTIPFLIFERKFKALFRFHWGSLLLAFFATATPWFAFSAKANSEFLTYFFWNENLARYLVEDYGDRYGDGHVYPRGTSWPMLIIAFMPWTIPLIIGIIKDRKSLQSIIKSNQWYLYLLCWGLSPAIFFSFGRQLHISYLLPAIPGLALLFAVFLNKLWSDRQKTILYNSLSYLCFTACVGLQFVAFSYKVPDISILIFSSICLFFFLPYRILKGREKLSTLPHTALQVCFSIFCGVTMAIPIVNVRKSSNQILEQILNHSGESHPRVGLVTTNNYSPYWLSSKWELEGKPSPRIEYISNSPDLKDLPNNLILKKGSEVNLAPNIFNQYEMQLSINRWCWYKIKK